MKLAFYAPMKPPDHPVPSGDRTMARSLMAALADAGAQVTLASRLSSRDGTGAPDVQQALLAKAEAALPQIIAAGAAQGWQAWITYHSYYKAPDLLGPAVARALSVPYVQIEATRARKRLSGPWARFARAAEAACDAADAICYLTRRDAEALQRNAPSGQRLVHLPPFLDRRDLPEASDLSGPMLSVGMLRQGDKLGSYEIIAQTLAALPDSNWRLQIIGDGPARAAVAGLMAPFGTRVEMLGALEPPAMAAAYKRAGLLLWPGVNEAFGLAYLEAQAAGLPVVAQDRPGVREVLAPRPAGCPTPEAGPEALAQSLQDLLQDPALRADAGAGARAHVARHHLRGAATQRLQSLLSELKVTP